jgi:hypothetical protein
MRPVGAFRGREWRMMSRYQVHSQWWELQVQQAPQVAAGSRQQAAGGRRLSRLTFRCSSVVSEGARCEREIATEVIEANQRRERQGGEGRVEVRVVAAWWHWQR